MSTSGLGDRHLGFPTSAHVAPTTSDIVHSATFGMPDQEHMVFAFGIWLVSGLQHDIHELPVLAAAILDFQNFCYLSIV